MSKKVTSEKMRLNKRTVEGLEPPPEQNGKPRQRWVYDEVTPHLAMCVWSSGTKIWYWCGRFDSTSIKHKLGTFPDLTPENAKKAAAKVSAGVADGIDPRDARRKHRADMTIGQLFAWFIEHYAKPHKKASSVAEDEGLFKRYLEPWKGKKISTVKRSDVRTLHAKIGRQNGSYAANRMLSLLGTMYSEAIKSDDVTFSGDNPTKGVKRFDEKSRERFLRNDELQAFFAALEELHPTMRDYFLVALMTGARRGNVQAMRWKEIHLDRGEWSIPDTKTNQSQTVHLPAAAVELLRERRKTVEGEYVFPAMKKTSRNRHIVYQYNSWKTLCKSAGLEGIRPHDLRRSLGSWMAAGGASLPVIGKSLGHKHQSTTAIYSRLDLDPVRGAVDLAVEAMLAAAKPEEK